MRILLSSVAILLTAVLVATGIFVSGVVQASHNFSDVPTTAFYHNAVEWIFNRGITAGCAVGMYCPDVAVTRGTMAVFLQKLGQALTPVYLDASQISTGVLDLDAQPVICQTTDFAVTGYRRTALIDGQVYVITDISMEWMGFDIVNVYSANGGATWTPLNVSPQGDTIEAFRFGSANVHARVDLNVGSSYKFGMKIRRNGGLATADIANAHCELYVAIVNRNGTTSPLSPLR